MYLHLFSSQKDSQKSLYEYYILNITSEYLITYKLLNFPIFLYNSYINNKYVDLSSNSLTNDENIAHRPIISNYIFIKLAVSGSLRLAFATTKISLGFPH